MKNYLLSLALVISCPVAAQQDVERFERNAGLCDHFAGEFDPDLRKSERQRIIRSTNRYCGRAKRQLDQLSEKYKQEPDVLDRLNQYETVKSYSP